MHKLSILHIGDIHFNKEIHQKLYFSPIKNGEYNWSELSPLNRKKIAPYLIKIIKKNLYEQIESSQFDAIAFSGDLCSRGVITDYERCLDYLDIQFQYFSKELSKGKVEITVGNHDLDADIEYDQNNVKERFLKFCELLESKQFNKYPILEIHKNKIETDNGKLLILNVNSCLEFGNIDNHSEVTRKVIRDILKGVGGDKERNRLLNVPCIRNSLLTSIIKEIESNPDYIPLIITHHNFLPSSHFTPDKEYDGMLNNGIIMQKLLDLKTSVLVLHGHIHDDPIRVFQSKYGKIIYISAPLLFPLLEKEKGMKFGYNVINLIYSETEKKKPMGCEIHQYYLNNYKIKCKTIGPIIFLDAYNNIKELTGSEKEILKKIHCYGRDLYLNELINEAYSIDQLEQIVDRLFWFGLIQLEKNPTVVGNSVVGGWFNGNT